MKRKVFYSIMLIAFAFFAVISMGGCGGSSSSSIESENLDNTTSESEIFALDQPDASKLEETYASSDIAKFLYSMHPGDENYHEWLGNDEESFEEFFARAGSNDVLLVYRISEYNQVSSAAGDKTEVVDRSEILKTAFNRGAFVTLVYPSADDINKLYSMLDIKDNYNFSDETEIPRKELYAISKKSTANADLVFVYSIESDNNVSYSAETPILSDDLSVSFDNASGNEDNMDEISQDIANRVISEVLNNDSSGIDSADKETSGDVDVSEESFHRERLNRFLDFVEDLNSSLGVYDGEAAAFKSSLMAADDNIDLSSVNGEITVLDKDFIDYKTKKFRLFSNNDSFNVNLARKNEIRISTYSCHSFSNGYDYYLLQADTTTIPQSFVDEQGTFKRGGFNVKLNYLHGFTKSFGIESWINMDNATIFKSLPGNINPSTNHSESMGWELGGSVGFDGKSATGSITGKISHNQSTSWTTREYEIKNETVGSRAKWNAVYQNPSNGGKHSSFPYEDGYYGVNAKASSTERTTFRSEWLWIIPRESWLKNPGAPEAWVKENWSEGFCIGECWYTEGSFPWPTHIWDRYDASYGFSTASQKIKMPVPPRIATSGAYFHPGAGGQDYDFDLYADGNWTVTTDSWIHLSESSSSGSATGANPKRITFHVDANPTGKFRTGYLTVKTPTDELKLEVVQSY